MISTSFLKFLVKMDKLLYMIPTMDIHLLRFLAGGWWIVNTDIPMVVTHQIPTYHIFPHWSILCLPLSSDLGIHNSKAYPVSPTPFHNSDAYAWHFH